VASVQGEEVVDRVRQYNDIVEVITDYVALKRSGKNYFGLCPFHPEKTPSFSVSPEKQMFYCFGCQTGGDVFSFIMKKEGLDFRGALEFLADRAGIELPQPGSAGGQASRERQELYRVLEGAARYFENLLRSGPGEPARRYLKDRGLDPETVERFRLGYAGRSWDGLLKAFTRQGIELARLEQAGLILPRRDGSGYYDRFRDRVIFPIRDRRGRVIGFGGRSLNDGTPKYLNSPETALFHKRETWYALDLAREEIRRTGTVLVVEGYMDAIAGHQYGFKNVVASLGTSLTLEQARILSTLASEVVISYDADAAGTTATMRGLEILSKQGLRVRVVTLPVDADPDSFLRSSGAEAFKGLLAGALPLVEYRFRRVLKKHGTSTVEGKVRVVREIVPTLAEIENEVERSAYIEKFSHQLGVREDSLRHEVGKYRQRKRQRRARTWGPGHRNRKIRNNRDEHRNEQIMAALTAISEKTPLAVQKAEETLVRLVLNRPEIIERIAVGLSPDGFEGFEIESYRKIAGLLAKAYRDSIAAGKGFDTRQVLSVFDDEQTRSLVSRLLIEEGLDRLESEKVLNDCIITIKVHKMKKRRFEITRIIAEREGKGVPIEKELLEEYQELSRCIEEMERQR